MVTAISCGTALHCTADRLWEVSPKAGIHTSINAQHYEHTRTQTLIMLPSAVLMQSNKVGSVVCFFSTLLLLIFTHRHTTSHKIIRADMLFCF